MKNNKIGYIIVAILSVTLGCLIMYGVMYLFPNNTVKTITEEKKTVNVVDEGISEGINNVYNSVVVIETYKNNKVISTGSGFAFKEVNNITYVMTNNHVISNGTKVVLTLPNDEEIEASIVGSDSFTDIAVLKVASNKNLKIAKISSANNVKVGDTVFAVGAPLGKQFKSTVTRGILSGKDRLVETTSSNEELLMNVMQTDASINPGNSGGPLCDASGNVIGVTSLKIVESSVEGLGFAIQIDDAVNYANNLIENGKIVRGYVGIKMINATETFQLLRSGISIDSSVTDGVVVVEVINNSPASRAGLKSSDVIVKVGKDNVKSIAEFRYYLYKYKVGDEVELTVYRNGKTEKIKVKIEEAD